MNLLTKLLNTIQDTVEVIEDQYGYLRCRTNWHKHPIISKLCCAIGRHDDEFVSVEVSLDGRLGGNLECFYCQRKKRSWTNGGDKIINVVGHLSSEQRKQLFKDAAEAEEIGLVEGCDSDNE